MGTLMIKCPETGSAISTGIQTDRVTFNNTPVFLARTLCPLCQTQHEWFARAAWVYEPKIHEHESVNAARSDTRPSIAALRHLKWVAIAAIFAAAGVSASFAAKPAAGDTSSGSIARMEPTFPIADKSTAHPTYAITFPEVNRATKGNRLRVLISDDLGNDAIENVNKNRSTSSPKTRVPREVKKGS